MHAKINLSLVNQQADQQVERLAPEADKEVYFIYLNSCIKATIYNIDTIDSLSERVSTHTNCSYVSRAS